MVKLNFEPLFMFENQVKPHDCFPDDSRLSRAQTQLRYEAHSRRGACRQLNMKQPRENPKPTMQGMAVASTLFPIFGNYQGHSYDLISSD